MLFSLTSEIKSWFFFCCLDVNSSKPILYIWKRTVDFRVDKLFLKVIITAELKLSVLLSYSFCIVSGKSRCFLVSQKVVHFRFLAVWNMNEKQFLEKCHMTSDLRHVLLGSAVWSGCSQVTKQQNMFCIFVYLSICIFSWNNLAAGVILRS